MSEFVNLFDSEDFEQPVQLKKSEVTVVGNDSEFLQDINSIPSKKIIIEGPDVLEKSFTLDDECCDPANAYGDTYENGAFKRENLFSEITTEYERALIRRNLGIGDQGVPIWGTIVGNVANQKDLYDFVTTFNARYFNSLLSELNSKLLLWKQDIDDTLANSASINSPNFLGIPTTTTPTLQDYSNRIPTTEWVTNKINENNVGSLNWFRISQDFKYVDDPPVTVELTWEYNEPIENQKINNVSLLPGARSFLLRNLDSSGSITLSYTVEGKIYSRTLYFEIIYPTYYGREENYIGNIRTRDKEFLLDTGLNYGYIFIPDSNIRRIAVNNIVGGFEILDKVLIHNTQYTVYKTYNNSLGKLNISIL